MANLELANLLSPAASAPGNAVIAGTGAVAAGPAAPTSFFNRLLQASVVGEAAGATTSGLALLSADRWRTSPADPALLAAQTDPASAGAASLDLQVAASALMGTAALDEDGLGEQELGEADLEAAASTDDVGDTQVPDLTVWPGLPLFIEARAALRNGESAEGQPVGSAMTASAVAMETTRLQFRLQSPGRLGSSGSEGRISDGLPGNPPVIPAAEGDGNPLSPLTGEIDAIVSAAPSEEGAEPGRLNPVASLATGRTGPADQVELAELDSLKLRNPVAQLATAPRMERAEPGSLNPVAQLATAPRMERAEPGPLNPVAQLATAPRVERAEPGPLNPVAQLATAPRMERAEPGPLNPVAQLATAPRVERSEPGPFNPVAPPTGMDRNSPITAATVITTPVVGHTDKTAESIAITRNENAAVRDRVTTNPPAPQLANVGALPLHPLIAEPFTEAESGRLTADQAISAEAAAVLEEAALPNGARPERPATSINPPSVLLPDAAPIRRPPTEPAVAATAPRQEPVTLDTAPTPRATESAPLPAAGSLPQTGLSSTVAPTRPDSATAPTSLPTTPDVIDLNQKNWGRALGHQLNWMVNNQLEQAAIRVNPPDLGPIELRVSLQHNQTSVTFFCHEAAVREALETALPRLREMLDSQGITLNQAQVSDQSLARQQAGSGGQPSFGQRDDRSPAPPPTRETVANEVEPRPRVRRLPGEVDDYA